MHYEYLVDATYWQVMNRGTAQERSSTVGTEKTSGPFATRESMKHERIWVQRCFADGSESAPAESASYSRIPAAKRAAQDWSYRSGCTAHVLRGALVLVTYDAGVERDA